MDFQSEIETDTSLYNRLIPFVWLIEIYKNEMGSKNKDKIWATLSGFGLHSSNLIVTCISPITENGVCFRAKRVTGNDCFKDCVIVKEWSQLHLVVLRVEGIVGDNNVVELGTGNLDVGERVFHIGHPLGFEASFLSGEVAFPCRQIDYKVDKQTCDHYENSIADQCFSDYRIMGNYFNVKWFKNSINKGSETKKYKGLHPRIPIVQLNGMTVKSGCYGGPLFNCRGQVVGIMFGGIIGYPTAIHVSVLNKVKIALKKLSEKHELEKSEKKRVLPEHHGASKDTNLTVQDVSSVSKKTKA